MFEKQKIEVYLRKLKLDEKEFQINIYKMEENILNLDPIRFTERLLDENQSKAHFENKVNNVPENEEMKAENALRKSKSSHLNEDNSLSSRFMRGFQQDVEIDNNISLNKLKMITGLKPCIKIPGKNLAFEII